MSSPVPIFSIVSAPDALVHLIYIFSFPPAFIYDFTAIVRKEKARAVEDMLLQAATSGRLGGKVTEEQLIQMLEQVSSQVEKKATKVTIQRRRYLDEDDDDNDDDLL